MSVPAQHQTSAAGLISFLRTLCGAIGTAIATTAWDDASRTSRSELVSSLNNVEATMTSLQNAGFTLEQARAAIERLVEVRASTIGVNHLFLGSGVGLVIAAISGWLDRKSAVEGKEGAERGECGGRRC